MEAAQPSVAFGVVFHRYQYSANANALIVVRPLMFHAGLLVLLFKARKLLRCRSVPRWFWSSRHAAHLLLWKGWKKQTDNRAGTGRSSAPRCQSSSQSIDPHWFKACMCSFECFCLQNRTELCRVFVLQWCSSSIAPENKINLNSSIDGFVPFLALLQREEDWARILCWTSTHPPTCPYWPGYIS